MTFCEAQEHSGFQDGEVATVSLTNPDSVTENCNDNISVVKIDETRRIPTVHRDRNHGVTVIECFLARRNLSQDLTDVCVPAVVCQYSFTPIIGNQFKSDVLVLGFRGGWLVRRWRDQVSGRSSSHKIRAEQYVSCRPWRADQDGRSCTRCLMRLQGSFGSGIT